MEIPIIDFQKCGLMYKNDNEIEESSFIEIGEKLFKAFSTSGFAYITNHGIPDQVINEANKVSDDFFATSLEYKMKFCSKSTGVCYDPIESVNTNLERPADFVEGLRLPSSSEFNEWPDIENLNHTVDTMQKLCKTLTLRIFKALGRGMKLKNKDLFFESHNLIGKKGNQTLLKLLHYPPLVGAVLKKNQLRCGEHADIGSLTILFQDDLGGLQVQTPGGEFIDAHPIPGTALLNIGDMLQFWCGKRLKSTVHRVILPTEPSIKSQVRRCLAYFGFVDDDVLLSELEFEDSVSNTNIKTEKRMTSYEYWNERFAAHFFKEK
uniref:UPF0676 protein C1494.01-like n=1 Tax=Styela clava TaxID=7725 RepID=UPI001939FE3F|nr:UPF0676 protein C1494.01-like [Styela clava]